MQPMNQAIRIGAALVFLTLIAAFGVLAGITGGYSVVDAEAADGKPMPDFALKDCDGTQHTLTQYKGHIVVLDFCSIECPYSKGADPQLTALAAKYAPQSVVFLGVDSNKNSTPEQIKAYADEAKKTFPILKDVDNVYADKVGATVTPEIFVIDPKGVLVYRGAFDNRTAPTEVGKTCYTSDAIDAVLAGRPVSPSSVKAWGCGIKRVK
jgi:thiol-disulfide isomerase/thioredoxin